VSAPATPRGMSRDELAAVVNDCPFHRFLNLGVVSADPAKGEVVLRLPFRAEFSRSAREPQLHGGITAALIDIAGDYAVAVMLGRGVPTINLRIDYLRMGGGGALLATARVVKPGRTIGLVDVEVREEDGGRLIAVGRGDYSMA
jgi:uncharacterized protein (TIGR00369 family)